MFYFSKYMFLTNIFANESHILQNFSMLISNQRPEWVILDFLKNLAVKNSIKVPLTLKIINTSVFLKVFWGGWGYLEIYYLLSQEGQCFCSRHQCPSFFQMILMMLSLSALCHFCKLGKISNISAAVKGVSKDKVTRKASQLRPWEDRL